MELILDTGKEEILLTVESVKFFKQFVILKFKGIDNINDIEKYKTVIKPVFADYGIECFRDRGGVG